MVSLGIGTWAMGGPFWAGTQAVGWGPTDDAESERALRRALELGATLFDTADVYGTGHAEELLGRVFAGRRDEIRIATKWGNVFDPAERQIVGHDGSVPFMRRALEGSLRRLGTDYVDIYQLHRGDLPLDQAAELREACEELVAEGKIRAYGWSTDDPERAAAFGSYVQAEMNVLHDRPDMYPVLEARDLTMLCRGPLAMGLLTGRDWATAVLPDDDVRNKVPEWMQFFKDGKPTPEFAKRVEAVREVLTSRGRTLSQGALAWIWARCDRAVPIPGCRTVAQVEENVGALEFGALTPSELAEVQGLLAA
ncbi:aldo/keto reductase [Kutzneria buriramensis]|uniref:Aryl-alcohol dehydrogenase-like predicted oxidoreductase n=1 Tax=Kutzneria buriramensis TaxID=1045776 RepID=A0A3E0HVC7_9PSEU|nr:aldo/keto reductase [Kutzneria buriramensis]REH50351.1 aryl-alcohol dehydrogenase-like predicted oxidoreductase [Kutzneria buriramensis]